MRLFHKSKSCIETAWFECFSSDIPIVTSDVPTDSCFLDITIEDEIISLAKEFRTEKATGYDKVSMDNIKDSIDSLSKPLMYLINSAI